MRLCRLWRVTTGLCAGGLVTLAGCGTPGAPLPPTLNLPRPVADLSAERHGNTVALHWTTPAKTTDKLPLRGDIRMTLCRKADATQCTPIPGTTETPGSAATYEDLLPAALTTGAARLLEYHLIAANNHDRSAGDSNTVLVVGGEGPQGVTALTAAVIERGVLLHWHREEQPAQPVMYVLRRELVVNGAPGETGKNTSPKMQRLTLTANGGSDPGLALDETARAGDTYRYTVERVERVEIAGASYDLGGFLSDPVTVEVRDTFPPRVPSGLAAVGTAATGGVPAAIDLSWSANTENDLAGYFVYRRDVTAGQATAARLNANAAPAPAFHDAGVTVGHRYAYSVSAVDRTGNESARSGETEETAPQ